MHQIKYEQQNRPLLLKLGCKGRRNVVVDTWKKIQRASYETQIKAILSENPKGWSKKNPYYLHSPNRS